MLYAEKKIKKIIDELEKNIYSNELDIMSFYKKNGYYKSIDEVENAEEPWSATWTEDFWGGIDNNCWCKFDVEIPEKFKGQNVAIFVSTGEYDLEKEETTTNPQILFYLNNKIIQGFDINHREHILTKCSSGNEKYRIDLKVNSGMFDRKFHFVIKLVVIDEYSRGLFYDIKVPFQAALEMDESDYMRRRIIGILEDTINIIDFRKPGSCEYVKSIKSASKFIESEFYHKECGKHDLTASVIGHTHIDVAWLWTVAQTREKVVRSFSTVLELMSQYPEYKFMSSTPQLYQFIKEDYPEIYENIKLKIASGRWEAEGGMWVESDCNMVSGRSLARQFMYGNKFFKSEFAVSSKILWLPDAFGYCPSLPQIMKKSGIEYFVSCKMGWSDSNRLPNDTFYWKGIDGTEILSHMITTTYPRQSVTSYATDYNGQLFPETVMGAWNTYRQQDVSKDVLITFGYGDGGGGPTKEMLENQRRMSKGIPGCPKTNVRTVREFFHDLKKEIGEGKKLPKWSGELYLETHRGTYTSMARNKKSNRYCDMILGRAEKLGSIDMLLSGSEYPNKQLENNWKTVLMNQFHDILPGSSIKEVYQVTKKEYFDVESEVTMLNKELFSKILRSITTDDNSIIVLNTLGFLRTDVVEIEGFFSNTTILMDLENGKEVLVQKTETGIVFVAEDIPSMGYKKYEVTTRTKKIQSDDEFYMDEFKLENQFYNIKLDTSGAFASIYDKEEKRELLQEGELGNRLICYENKPHNFDNWNIDANYREKSWDIDQVISIDLVESGQVRKVLEVKKKFIDSIIIQKIVLYKSLRRIDFKTMIDMKMTDVLVKCEFPVEINTDYGSFETAYGNTRRSSHCNTSWDMANYEVPGHRWADLSEAGYGFSLLNDSRYGYSVKNNILGLSLVKPGTYPNPDADIEVHHLQYSIYPHRGYIENSGTHKEAEKINESLVGICREMNNGKYKENLSFFRVDCDNIIIDSIKKCEESDDLIITLYEFCNKRSKCMFTSFFDIKQVWECNFLEDNIMEYEYGDNSIEFEMKPFEIKVFKIGFQKH